MDLPPNFYDLDGRLFECDEDVQDGDTCDHDDICDKINDWFEHQFGVYMKLTDKQVASLHSSPIITKNEDKDNTCMGDTVELAGAGGGYSRIVNYDSSNNTYRAYDMEHGSGLSSNIPADIVEEFEFGERIAMGLKTAALLVHGWCIFDWSLMYDDFGEENPLAATQTVMEYHEDTKLWITFSFEGIIYSYSLSEMAQNTLVWQHPDYPFKQYNVLWAIGDSPKYHSTVSGDVLLLREGSDEDEYKLICNSATKTHHLIHATQPAKTKKNFDINSNKLFISDRPGVKHAIESGRAVSMDSFGPTSLFEVKYHMIGIWQVMTKTLGDLNECYVLSPTDWKIMIFTKTRGLVNEGESVSLNSMDVKRELEQGHRIWLRYKKLNKDDIYETAVFPSNYDEVNELNELLDRRQLLTQNLDDCNKYMNKLQGAMNEIFNVIIYRQVVNAVAACNKMIDDKITSFSEDQRPSMDLVESDEEYVCFICVLHMCV